MRTLPRLLTTSACFLAAAIAGHSAELPDDLSDDKILGVIKAVSRHQVRPLKDGDYKPVATVEEAKAAAQPTGISWTYPWGVTLYGTLRSTDLTGDEEVETFVLEHNRVTARSYAWIASLEEKLKSAPNLKDFLNDRRRFKVRGLVALGNLDNCGAMGTEILEGILRHPEQETAEEKLVVTRIADWIVNKQERLPDGTFWREKSADDKNIWPRGTIWIDDLYMSCPFLVRWAKYTGDNKYIDDAARQILNMAGRVQDSDGVWFHAYSEPKKEHSPIKWGRANGWAMVAAAEILSVMPEDHPLRSKLLNVFRRQVEGVKALQPASGVWRQVLDKPELWEETSCTAMFAYSIARAVNRGWIEPNNMAIARKAFAGLTRFITPEGVVKGTCQGTGIGFTVEFYETRPRPDDDEHGRGVVLLAGTEILAAGKKRS